MTSSGHSMGGGRAGIMDGFGGGVGGGIGGRGYPGFENVVNRNRFGGGVGGFGMNNANNHGGMGGPNNPGAGGNNNNSATLNSALMEPMSPEVIQGLFQIHSNMDFH